MSTSTTTLIPKKLGCCENINKMVYKCILFFTYVLHSVPTFCGNGGFYQAIYQVKAISKLNMLINIIIKLAVWNYIITLEHSLQ